MESEKLIIQQIINGQTELFKILVDKYQQPVYNVIFKIVNNCDDAGELTQEVFVKTYESLLQYNSSYKFFSWIYRIAINQALQFAAAKKRQLSFDNKTEKVEFFSDCSVDEEQRNQLLNASVNKLDSKYRSVILLKYYAKLSYAQIAEILDLPEKMVKSRLFEARKILKESLVGTDYFSMIQYN